MTELVLVFERARQAAAKQDSMEMSSMFSFRTRNPDRDRDTDRARIERLSSLADAVADEVARERDGLRKRRQREVDDAGFLLEAQSSGDTTEAAEKRLDSLSASVMLAETRLVQLDRQLAWLRELRQTIAGFPLDTSPAPADGDKPQS